MEKITKNLLKELTEEQKERLLDWWKPSPGDWVWDEGYQSELMIPYNCKLTSVEHKLYIVPLLSVGQCFRFLFDKGLSITNMSCYNTFYGCGVTEITFEYEGNNEMNTFKIEGESLVDALWCAVKEIL